MAQDRTYDLCVIGGGPGGYVAAIRAAQLGLKTLLVEEQELGGVCLNKGCIPTKAMLRSAEVLQLAQGGERFGVKANRVKIDMQGVRAFRDRVVETNRKGIAALLEANGVEVTKAHASLEDARTLKLSSNGKSRSTTARNVLIATGSLTAPLPVPGGDLPRVIDSDQALELEAVPGSVVVIGGGAVGVEWASVLRAFGSEVTVVEMLPALLPLEDQEMGRTLERSFKRQGIKALTSAKVTEVVADGKKALEVVVAQEGKAEERLRAEYVLVGVGRRPNTAGLGLAAIDVKTERGWVEVDDHQRTSAEGVYAIGDVTGQKLLAHVASHQGIAAVENMAGIERAFDSRVVPSVTFSHPEVASVGLSEAQARQSGEEVVIGRFPFGASGRAMTLGQTEGLVKIVAGRRYGQVLGVHIIGPNAGELIAEGVLAIKLEATLDELAETIHAHPTLPETVMEAALVGLDRPIHVARGKR